MSDSPIISFAANLIGGVVGASMQDPVAGATTSAFVASAIENVPKLLHRGRSAADAEGMKALHERIEELQEKMRELQDATKGAAPTATDVSATLQAYLDAWASSHDNRVREFARNAAVNAFDPARYEEGLTRTLFAILGRLEYGDIDVLRKLEMKRSDDTVNGSSLFSFHASRLVDERLARTVMADGSGILITELGQRLLKLIESPRPC